MKRILAVLLILICLSAAAEPALTVGSTSISDGEVMAYSWSAGESYRETAEYYKNYLGIDYWTLSYPDGMSIEDSITFDVFKELLITCALCEKAGRSGVSLSASDREMCKEEASLWYKELASPAFSVEDVINLFEKQLLAQRVYAVLVLDTDIDESAVTGCIDTEDYRVYEAEYLYTVSDDENIHTFMLNSADFTIAALLNSSVSCGSFCIDSESNSELLSAVKKLMPGESSGVIKTDYGFFLLRLTAIDESSKESVLGRSIYAAREAAFLPEYEKLFKDASYTIHDSFRSSVILR